MLENVDRTNKYWLKTSWYYEKVKKALNGIAVSNVVLQTIFSNHGTNSYTDSWEAKCLLRN